MLQSTVTPVTGALTVPQLVFPCLLLLRGAGTEALGHDPPALRLRRDRPCLPENKLTSKTVCEALVSTSPQKKASPAVCQLKHRTLGGPICFSCKRKALLVEALLEPGL